jgi:hypothetical protein
MDNLPLTEQDFNALLKQYNELLYRFNNYEIDNKTSTVAYMTSNTTTSVDSEVALFNGTTGKALKRATGTGFAYLTDGVLSLLSSTNTITKTAYESVSARQCVKVSIGTFAFLTRTSTSFTDLLLQGDSSSRGSLAVKFTTTAASYINRCIVNMKKVGTPTDNLSFTIVADNAGAPTGSVMGTSDNVAGSGLSTSASDYNFDFSTPAVIPAGTYWAKLSRATATDTTNYYAVSSDGASANANNQHLYNGGWANTSNVTISVQRFEGTAGQVIKAKGFSFGSSNAVGFVPAAILAGASGDVQLAGVVTGFSSLTIGMPYYLQDDGTIGTTAGTYSKKVGIALSDTELLMQIS